MWVLASRAAIFIHFTRMAMGYGGFLVYSFISSTHVLLLRLAFLSFSIFEFA